MTTPRGPRVHEFGCKEGDLRWFCTETCDARTELMDALARAKRAEGDRDGLEQSRNSALVQLTEAEAQVAAMRGQVEQCRIFFEENRIESPKDDLEKRIDWGMREMLKKIPDLPPSEIGKALAGLVEAAELTADSGCDCQEANHENGLMQNQVCDLHFALAALRKAGGA